MILILIGNGCSSATEPTGFAAYTHPVEYLDRHVTWSVPTTGTPPVKYVVQQKIDNNDWIEYATTQTNSIWVRFSYNHDHIIRVAAIDINGKQGMWSVNSDTYSPYIEHQN